MNDIETMPLGNMFTKTIGDISHGDLVDQSSEMLQQLAIAVRESFPEAAINFPRIILGSIATTPRAILNSTIRTN